MKNLKILLSTAALFTAGQLFAQSKTTTIEVQGNCGMCKKKIEKAAKLPGVTAAVWDKKTKELTVSYNTSKVSTEKIEKNIANAGYDTEHFKAPEKAYKALDECCQYDRK